MKFMVCSKRIYSPILRIELILSIRIGISHRQCAGALGLVRIIFNFRSGSHIVLQLQNKSPRPPTMHVNSEQQTPYLPSDTPFPPTLDMAEEALLQQVLRVSLEVSNHKAFSRANALPHCYYKRIKSMKMGRSKQTCSVCIDCFQTDELIKRLPCGHILHGECAKGWLKVNKRCPVCRLDIEQHFRSQEQPPSPKELLY